MSSEIINNKLYIQITELLRLARQSVVRAVNQTMVCAYYDIGKIIVEDEQRGKQRADYGKHVLEELSKKIDRIFLEMLLCRQFTPNALFFYHLLNSAENIC